MYEAKKICTIGSHAYRPGDPVEITEKEAQRYLDKDFIEKMADKTPVQKQKDKGADNGSK